MAKQTVSVECAWSSWYRHCVRVQSYIHAQQLARLRHSSRGSNPGPKLLSWPVARSTNTCTTAYHGLCISLRKYSSHAKHNFKLINQGIVFVLNLLQFLN
jgi:hypothetical protein